MTGATPDITYKNKSAAKSKSAAQGYSRTISCVREPATFSQLLPIHRLTVIAKTPVLISFGLYMTGGRFAWSTVGATLALGSLLWAALYAVNEAFDLTLEEDYVVPTATIAGLVGAVVLVCGAAYLVSPVLALLFLLMTAGQLAYCVPPMRLKRWWWPVLLLSGVFNPLLRAYCGAIWGPVSLPALGLLSIVLIHVGSTIRTRALQRERDRKLDYRIAPPTIDRIGALFTALGLLDGAWLCAVNTFPRIFLLSARSRRKILR